MPRPPTLALPAASCISRAMPRAASGTSSDIPTKCGSTACTWPSRSTPNMPSMFHHPEAFADIAHQFVLVDEHARDPKTGLLYHGWDESKQERWADKQTGVSSEFWARAMGWYMMALVDTLDYFPPTTQAARQLHRDLQARCCRHRRAYQDGATGLWYQVLDKSRRERKLSSSRQPPACLSTRLPRACAAAISP